MRVINEISLSDFDFWSGAADRAAVLTDDQFDQIEAIFEDMNPDGMTDTEINDIFWFEEETIAEWLGFESFEALERYNNGEDDDEDDDE